MEADKSLVSGSMALLVLKLLEDGDKYGYQMCIRDSLSADRLVLLCPYPPYPWPELRHLCLQRGGAAGVLSRPADRDIFRKFQMMCSTFPGGMI